MALFDHQTAAQTLAIELEYEPLMELAQQHRAQDARAVAAVIELLTSFDPMFNDPAYTDGDDTALFWQLRDLKPSVMVTLLLLVDSAHCRLAEVLQAWSQDSPYEGVVAEAFRAHLEASGRTTQAIAALMPERDRRF